MALRLAKSIIRGEVDNRTPGRIEGKVWLFGRKEPIVLELVGNCQPDLAGCKLWFENPFPAAGESVHLNTLQQGHAGDMTASRKVKLLNVPPSKPKGEPDEAPVFGNAVYLEWYSSTNGRVIIESADFQLRLSDHDWSLQDGEQQEASADVEATEPLLDEFEWESFMRQSDEIAKRYAKALQRFSHHPDRDRLVAREMGWGTEEDLELPTPWDEESAGMISFCPLVPNPATEGRDWCRTADGEIHHPLTVRCHAFSLAVWQYCNALGLFSDLEDEDLRKMVESTDNFSAKIAGALDSMAYDDSPDYGFMIAYLKRALGYLHDAINVLSVIEEKRLIPEKIQLFRNELFALREAVLALMDEFRRQCT